MSKKPFYVADSAVFIMGGLNIPFSKMITVSSVLDEMKSEESCILFDVAILDGLKIEAIDIDFKNSVLAAAAKTKDINELSETDIDILSKALEYKNTAILLTDDFSVQNVASYLGIEFDSVVQSGIKDEIIWQKQCIGCFRHFKDGEECPVCGSSLRKKMKKKKPAKNNKINRDYDTKSQALSGNDRFDDDYSEEAKYSYNSEQKVKSVSDLFRK